MVSDGCLIYIYIYIYCHTRAKSSNDQTKSIRPYLMSLNKSLSLGKLPSEWKEGRISAIFKKGSRKKAGNYRPISLTSIVCKIMEHCVRNHIVNT